MKESIHEERERLAQTLAAYDDGDMKRLLERAAELRKHAYREIPYDRLRDIAVRLENIETGTWRVPVQLSGHIVFELNYYDCDDEFDAPHSPSIFIENLKIDGVAPERITQKMDDMHQSDTRSTMYMHDPGWFTQINLPELKEVSELFQATCRDYGVDSFELRDRLKKVKECVGFSRRDEEWEKEKETNKVNGM